MSCEEREARYRKALQEIADGNHGLNRPAGEIARIALGQPAKPEGPSAEAIVQAFYGDNDD